MAPPDNITSLEAYTQNNMTPPKLDAPAPLFTARTTLGTRSLEEYRGKWLILFSHPADFTPVCTSEFIAFQKNLSEFKALNCELMGLSVDSVYSHIAWLESIEKNFGVKVTFPVIEDVSMAVSTAYGMIHESSSSTETVRSVFIIDSNGILRALTHYPLTVGRSISELLRLIKALQLSEKKDVAIPAEWQPGGDVLQNAPCELDGPSGDKNHKAWYYRIVANDTGMAGE